EEIRHKASDSLTNVHGLRVRAPKFPQVERRLLNWITYVQKSFSKTKLPLSLSIICQEAENIAREENCEGFSANTGWFTRFKARAGLARVSLSGEAADVDMEKLAEQLNEV